MARKSFFEIAQFHCPSKLDHAYCRHYYPKHLDPLRDEEITLLEIGVKRGNSLRMFKEFFPKGRIIGLDHMDCTAHAEDRIKVYMGQQQDPAVLHRILKENGPIDIVVDDGSHRAIHQRASFEYLYPKMSKRGIYFIEDLHFFSHTSSQQSWFVRRDGFVRKHDFVQYIFHLAKWPLLGYRHWKLIKKTDEEHRCGRKISAIHIYNKMIVVER